MNKSQAPFDKEYFDRFYESKTTRVYGAREIGRLARGVTDMIAWLGGDVRTVLDVGAGTGLWRDWFAAHRKGVAYVSTDVSAYACKRYGHKLRDITRWRASSRYDLVVCQGVLPYLDDEACGRAIENIAAMSRGFLYLEAVTARDLKTICHTGHTDLTMRKRSGAWYRRALAPHVVTLGCGLYYARTGPLRFYELEHRA